MSTYMEWMEKLPDLLVKKQIYQSPPAPEDIIWEDIESLVQASISIGQLPRMLSFESPVDITLYDSNGNEITGVVSWITDGKKFFFLPCGSDVSTATVVASGSGTMTFSIAKLTGSQPHEIKTFENANLRASRNFKIDLSEKIAISDVQLFIAKNGKIIGEIAEDGTETIY